MSERKVLNKYYPPDFDPVKLAVKSRQIRRQDASSRRKGPKIMNVRMMMPFTMCCSSCHEFAYVGKKFNSRVEKIQGEDYLGIAIWRFYGHCPNCCAEFSFKTDPQNTAYVLESGGTRTYDPHRDASLAESNLKDKMRAELDGDIMKTLEHKTYTTANELLDLEQLDEIRKLNKRLMNPDDVDLEAIWKADEDTSSVKSEENAEVEKFVHEQANRGPAEQSETGKSNEGSISESDEPDSSSDLMAKLKRRFKTEEKTKVPTALTVGSTGKSMQNIKQIGYGIKKIKK